MLKKNQLKKIIIIAALSVVSSIAIYEGHFLFKAESGPPNHVQPTVESDEPLKYEYRHFATTVKGTPQVVNILEFDPADERIRLKPVLSGDSVFGFEKLSSMVARKGSYAAVNAGFFHRYGEPAGLVVIDGEIVCTGTGRYPVFSTGPKKASLKEMQIAVYITDGLRKLKIDAVNRKASNGKAVLFNRYFGTDNGVTGNNLSIIIENGVIKKIINTNTETPIPENGEVVTVVNPSALYMKKLPFKEGDAVKIVSDPGQNRDTQAYECGSWIVKEGNIVIGSTDPWIGVTTNRDPRTALGIKNDGKVILMTVDGRQPGYSAGLTCRELGQMLLDMGVGNAAMLDGGASTVMIMEDRIVNKPSFKGQERPLGGGLVLELTEDG